jgi:hypothetical protein
VLARLAVAGAEAAIVEHEGGKAGGGKGLGILVEVVLLHGRKAVRHCDRQRATARSIGQVQPAAQR